MPYLKAQLWIKGLGQDLALAQDCFVAFVCVVFCINDVNVRIGF